MGQYIRHTERKTERARERERERERERGVRRRACCDRRACTESATHIRSCEHFASRRGLHTQPRERTGRAAARTTGSRPFRAEPESRYDTLSRGRHRERLSAFVFHGPDSRLRSEIPRDQRESCSSLIESKGPFQNAMRPLPKLNGISTEFQRNSQRNLRRSRGPCCDGGRRRSTTLLEFRI